MCFMTGCLGYGLYAVPDENLEEMPREIALDYLRNESGKYVSNHPCIYTNTGVVGYAYDELVWEQNPFGTPHIWLLGKGKGLLALLVTAMMISFVIQ